MKKLIFKYLKENILNWVLTELISDSFKKKLISKVNKTIDIPGLNEKEEEIIFLRLYEATVQSVTEQLS